MKKLLTLGLSLATAMSVWAADTSEAVYGVDVFTPETFAEAGFTLSHMGTVNVDGMQGNYSQIKYSGAIYGMSGTKFGVATDNIFATTEAKSGYTVSNLKFYGGTVNYQNPFSVYVSNSPITMTNYSEATLVATLDDKNSPYWSETEPKEVTVDGEYKYVAIVNTSEKVLCYPKLAITWKKVEGGSTEEPAAKPEIGVPAERKVGETFTFTTTSTGAEISYQYAIADADTDAPAYGEAVKGDSFAIPAKAAGKWLFLSVTAAGTGFTESEAATWKGQVAEEGGATEGGADVFARSTFDNAGFTISSGNATEVTDVKGSYSGLDYSGKIFGWSDMNFGVDRNSVFATTNFKNDLRVDYVRFAGSVENFKNNNCTKVYVSDEPITYENYTSATLAATVVDWYDEGSPKTISIDGDYKYVAIVNDNADLTPFDYGELTIGWKKVEVEVEPVPAAAPEFVKTPGTLKAGSKFSLKSATAGAVISFKYVLADEETAEPAYGEPVKSEAGMPFEFTVPENAAGKWLYFSATATAENFLESEAFSWFGKIGAKPVVIATDHINVANLKAQNAEGDFSCTHYFQDKAGKVNEQLDLEGESEAKYELTKVLACDSQTPDWWCLDWGGNGMDLAEKGGLAITYVPEGGFINSITLTSVNDLSSPFIFVGTELLTQANAATAGTRVELVSKGNKTYTWTAEEEVSYIYFDMTQELVNDLAIAWVNENVKIPAAKPTFLYTSTVPGSDITVSTATEGASLDITVTVNETVDAELSKKYDKNSVTFQLPGEAGDKVTIKAVAMAEGMEDSEPAERVITVTAPEKEQVAEVTIAGEAATEIKAGDKITLECATAEAMISYKLDMQDKDGNSLFSKENKAAAPAEITVPEIPEGAVKLVLTATASKEGMDDSAELTHSWTIASGIASILGDAMEQGTLYNLNGYRVNGTPAPGLYIVKTAGRTFKVIVK